MIVDPVQALADVPTMTSAKATLTPLPSIFPVEYQAATEVGKRTLWVVTVIMLIATLAFIGLSWSLPVSKRVYHIITAFITMTAFLSYFAMATGDGVSWHKTIEVTKNKHVPDVEQPVLRQVYWARYVDWAITTPLLLLDLSLLAGLSGAHILLAIVADLVMVLTGLFAAFGNEGTAQKWGWYTIACVAYLAIVWYLAIHGRTAALAKGGKVGGFFTSLALFTFLLWTAYPIVWGVADGARLASVDAEIVAYATLDVLAKPIFGLWLLLTHINMPETNVDLGGFWAHGLHSEGTIRVGEDDDGA